MKHKSVVCCGRAIPLNKASVRTRQCNSGVQRVQTAVTESALAVAPSPRCDAESSTEGSPTMTAMQWLSASRWHYCTKECERDVVLHGIRRYPTPVASVYPKLGEAVFYRNVGLWLDGCHHCNLVVASPQGVKEPRAVITNEAPTLQTLWQYALRFRVEELFQG